MAPAEPANGPPVACSLSPGETSERAGSFARIASEIRTIDELEDGFALLLAPGDETLRRLLELILAERRCCPFFRFELLLEPHRGPVRLRLRGPAEAKELIRPFLAERGAAP